MAIVIFHHARVYTMDPAYPIAHAIAFESGRSGRVLAVGDSDSVLAEFGGRARARALDGRVVIPGLIDAHIHLEQYAFSLRKIACETATRQECLDRVADRARETPPGEWILGHGWNQTDWEQGFGTAADLDRVAPDHPVYLTAKSLHAAWANSAALRAAGVHPQTSDPPGGQIQRDDHGDPTGILFETAMQLVSRAIPEPEPEAVAEAIRAALPSLWAVGLTGVHDFDRRRCFIALQVLNRRDELRLRVVKSLPVEDLPHAVALGLRSGFGDEFLSIGPVKAFADGALGPRTAAMFQPYDTEPGNRGILLLDSEELFEHGRLASANGLSMAVHAIGDRANHEVLTAYAQLRAFERANGLPHRRHRIEHVQILHSDDLNRLADLEIIASMQPVHATSDMFAADRYWGSRAATAYAWHSLLQRGTRLAFGSDAPVDAPNPFWGLHAAVTRRRAGAAPGSPGWYPKQRLAVSEALHGYTQGAAHAAGLEDRLGKLAPGTMADLLVLDADPFTCEPDALREIRPLATIIAGERVHGELPLAAFKSC